MFLELVMPSAGPPLPPPDQLSATALQAVDSLFLYAPLQIAALVETVWRNRYNPASAIFTPWPQWMTDAILDPNVAGRFISGYDFSVSPPNPIPQWPQQLPSAYPAMPMANQVFLPPNQLPGVKTPPAGNVQPTNWAHLIYAYLIENTRIFDIFARLLETYTFSEDLEIPSPASQIFWRNTEYLIYGDGIPSAIWNTTSRTRRDEIANRQTVYNWMFGIDLSHAADLAKEHPYRKPAASNRDFIPTFEAFAREVWAGIMNARNFSGANPTDPTVIATGARRLFDMLTTRRLFGNLSREEFRAVAVMSWLHLAVSYNCPAIVDLKCTAASPEQRLAKLAVRAGLVAHSKAKPLFDLAQPFSVLLQSIETGKFNDASGAALLYNINPGFNTAELNAEVVIDQYSLATGRDLKATSVVPLNPQQTIPPRPRAPAPVRPQARFNGRPT
ncbi:hypothetical protein OKW33_003356 [Paraburkholderia atlantica]|uniref:hypothetical protein n=1 Tax=Paraburkholderia TaxID=1822464 RepID=UPI00128B64E2|nr:hypothetical protein [Paraburkholderia atlantica]MPW10117.1 hypothetical protein [Paraburkholderia atlantica]